MQRASSRLTPVAVRLGAAGVILLGGWLLWRGLPTGAPVPAEEARGIKLQPTFTSTPVGGDPAEGAQAADLAQAAPAEAAPMQIIIVTPTPNASRQVTVGGAIIDRPLAVAGAEQPPVLNDMQPAVAGMETGWGQGWETELLRCNWCSWRLTRLPWSCRRWWRNSSASRWPRSRSFHCPDWSR